MVLLALVLHMRGKKRFTYSQEFHTQLSLFLILISILFFDFPALALLTTRRCNGLGFLAVLVNLDECYLLKKKKPENAIQA
jgi:hypothetical protein